MDELTADAIAGLPYTVLLDPILGRAAAYSQTRRMITSDASPALVNFARSRHVHQAAWSAARHGPHKLPDWATPDVRARCMLIWVREDSSNDAHLATVPRA